jgi:hypothetical protein
VPRAFACVDNANARNDAERVRMDTVISTPRKRYDPGSRRTAVWTLVKTDRQTISSSLPPHALPLAKDGEDVRSGSNPKPARAWDIKSSAAPSHSQRQHQRTSHPY